MSRLFGFHGRLGRSGYAALSLGVFCVVAMAAPLLLLVALERGGYGAGGLTGPGLLILPVVAVCAWSLLALSAKRLHDLDLRAWHLAWICAVPVAATALPVPAEVPASLLPWAWLCVAHGTEGANRFGPDPAPGAAGVPR